MEIASFAAAIAIVKNLKDLTTSLGDQVPEDVREQVMALSDRVMDMQTAALDAQKRETELTEQCRQLQAELGRMNDWETERARYTLQQIDGLAFVFAPERTGGEAPHWLCANCFEDRTKSYLQAHAGLAAYDRRNWECRRCRGIVVVNNGTTPGG